jgi:hypothetical protein
MARRLLVANRFIKGKIEFERLKMQDLKHI